MRMRIILAVALAAAFLPSRASAYVEAAQMVVSSNVAGRVSEIDIHDNELVSKGAVLFRIDDAPFRIAVQEAQARLAGARTGGRGCAAVAPGLPAPCARTGVTA